MTCAVVSVPAGMRHFIDVLLPRTLTCASSHRVYFLYRVQLREADFAFTDPTDGTQLAECKFFNDETTARAWVAADYACRNGEVVR